MTNDNPQEAAAELRFRLVVEAAPNAMVMINQAGAIVMVNVQAERVFGYSRDEVHGNCQAFRWIMRIYLDHRKCPDQPCWLLGGALAIRNASLMA